MRDRVLPILGKAVWVFPLAGLVLGYRLPGSALLYMFAGAVIAYGVQHLMARAGRR